MAECASDTERRGQRDNVAYSNVQSKLSMAECADSMVQRLNSVVLTGVHIMLDLEEFA